MSVPEPRPSASVILLRDGPSSLEVLLVRRHEAMSTHGGAWVFPGGKVDPADAQSRAIDHVETAKVAAVREVWEEAGITLSQEDLRPFSHWTTPVVRPRRFAAWFFVATLGRETQVCVDGNEIVDSRWVTVESALQARHRGEIVLPPPTFVTLQTLDGVAGISQLPIFLNHHVVERFNPKILRTPEGEVALYEGDAGYETERLFNTGARHRLQMLKSAWRYERIFTQNGSQTATPLLHEEA